MILDGPFALGWASRAGRAAVAVVVAVVIGCAEFTPVPNPVETDPREYSRMYRAAIEVLRESGFELDRRDFRYGRITTQPLASPTMMEPWHTSNTTAYQALESTLHDQRRRVCIFWDPITSVPRHVPIDQETQLGPTLSADSQLRVEVLVERREFSDRYLTGSTAGHRVFGSLSALPDELTQRGINTAQYWRPLGRDPYLEQRLLARIVRKSLTLPPVPPEKPSEPTSPG